MTDRTADGDPRVPADPDAPDPERPDPDDSGEGSNADPTGAGAARARIRTTHDRPAAVAAALRPDNTAEMDTRLVPAGGRGESGSDDRSSPDSRSSAGDGQPAAEDDRPTAGDGRAAVVTVLDRDRAAGLRSTVDDYLVNLDVADRTVRTATHHDTP